MPLSRGSVERWYTACMDESSGNKKQIIAVLAVLIVIVAIVGGAVALGGKNNEHDRSHASTTSATSQASSETQADANATYKDGEYEATGDYTSPGGSQEITVSVTVKDGVITDTSAQEGATDSESREHQEEFIDSYKTQVVGKKLSEISLSRVSGSSLTSQGFNDAIQQIRDQAAA